MTSEQRAEVKEKIAIEMLEHKHQRVIQAIQEENQLVFNSMVKSIKDQKKAYEITIENLQTDIDLANKRTTYWKQAYEDIEKDRIEYKEIYKYAKERHEIIKKSLNDTVTIKTYEDLIDQLLENNKILLRNK